MQTNRIIARLPEFGLVIINNFLFLFFTGIPNKTWDDKVRQLSTDGASPDSRVWGTFTPIPNTRYTERMITLG